MSVDVNNLGTYLAKLSPTQLGTYAELHKNNPYIVSMVLDESNRRKAAANAQKAQQGQMQQPKVVDTVIASMAADKGIAQLPAGDMNFADGGIVAFADGGDIPRYQSGGRTSVLAGTEYAIPGMTLPATSFMPQAGKGQDETPWLRRVYNDAQAQGLAYQVEQARARIAAGYGTSADRAILAQAEAAATEKASVPPTEVAANAPAVNRSLLNAAEQRAAPAAGAGAGAKTTDGKAAPAPTAAPAAAGLPAIGGLAAMRQNIANQQNFVDPAAAETAALSADLKAGAERRKQEFEDQVTKQGDVFKGREERLAKRESDLAGMKDQSLGLALLQAGAAMMSTPGGLAQAVGKGIDTGSKYYVAGMDKLRASQERLADARDRMEELRLNRDDMTARERRALSADIDRAQIEGRKLGIEGIRLAADVNEKRASDIFTKTVDLQKTAYEQAGANARANAQIAATLNTPERQLWNDLLAKHNGDTSAAFKDMQTQKAEKFNVYSSYADYLKAFAGKENVMSPPKDFADYASQFGMPTTSVPKGAAVRKLPNTP